MERILVGVDSAPASVDALRYAAQIARVRDATLEVVYVFAPPEQTTAFPVPPRRRDPGPRLEELQVQADERLEDLLRHAEVDLSGIEVECTVVPDKRPSRALVERSRDADLVVVASRGRGGTGGRRLGSVSEQVVRHARASVLLVRPSTRD